MTAEVAVMNKQAVALAADSAVTVPLPGGPKIYNSVNKLFAISKYAPVGVMVYGNAEFMQLPWEIIIKRYRNQLGSRRFDRLEEYAQAFLRHLNEETPSISPGSESAFVRGTVHVLLRLVRSRIDKDVEAHLQRGQPIAQDEVSRIASGAISGFRALVESERDLPTVPATFDGSFDAAFGEKVKDWVAQAFEQLPLDDSSRTELFSALRASFRKPKFTGTSGLVIAGFGESEVLPRLRAYELDGVLCGFLRYREANTMDVAPNNNAAIIPFAQHEVVSTFMEGIDPNLRVLLRRALEGLLRSLPDLLANAAAEAPLEATQLREGIERSLDRLVSEVDDFIEEEHVRPIISAVAMLPKDELAAMAEALVNLTSFRRRVSTDAETVGGPIDVAVISKGDGFVWIKRKHYFKPELNPGFLAKFQQGPFRCRRLISQRQPHRSVRWTSTSAGTFRFKLNGKPLRQNHHKSVAVTLRSR